MPRAGEQSTIAEGMWEEVSASRRNKVLLLRRARREGVDCCRNISLCAHADSQKVRLWVVRCPLCQLWVAVPPAWARWDGALLVWSIGSGGKPPQLSQIPEVGVANHH